MGVRLIGRLDLRTDVPGKAVLDAPTVVFEGGVEFGGGVVEAH